MVDGGLREDHPPPAHDEHRPPYRAVAGLSQIAVRDWRTLRARLALHGIPEPLGLSSLHHLLDIVEAMVIEGMSQKDVDGFYDSLYRPDPAKAKPTNVPGWSAADQNASFDAVLSMVGGEGFG